MMRSLATKPSYRLLFIITIIAMVAALIASLKPGNTNAAACGPAWVATTAYATAGMQVSRSGSNYHNAFWTQNQDPLTNSGPAGSGQPWVPEGVCGGTTATNTPTKTATVGGPTNTPTKTATAGGPTNTPTKTATTGPTTVPGARRYVAYASSWNTSIYDLTTANVPSYISHLNLAFVKPDTNYVKGSYEFDQAVAGFEFVEGATTFSGQKKFTAQQSTDLRNKIAALKARGTQVWISVGGWSYSQGSAWTNIHATKLVDLAIDLGASGIDIDWESSGSSCNKQSAATFSCTKDGEIANIVTSIYNARQGLQLSVAGWSTGAYYVLGTPFEEGKVQWGSPFGGTMYNVVKNHGSKLAFVNLMGYDGGDYYDPREGYESYKAIYSGPINIGIEIAPEGAGGAILELMAPSGTVYDAEMLNGSNNIASQYYNVQTLVSYLKNKGRSFDGMMIWQMWKERVHAPAPSGAASVNSAGQYICNNLPLTGNCSMTVPNLPKLTP
jgi:chitinase